MNTKRIRHIIITIVCTITCLIVYSFAYSYFCKNRVYTEIDKKISEEILSSNIEIIQQTFEGNNTSYSVGFSGVIFKRTGNKYYNLKVLDISDVTSKYEDKVVAISNPYREERNMITYGKITSRNLIGFNDEAGKKQYKNLKHSAFIDKGSSGSALINKDFKIVGINLGGGRDVFGNFRYGMAMPSDKINDFLDRLDNN